MGEEPSVLKDLLGGALAGFGGGIDPVAARNLGAPQTTGMTPQELQAFLMLPERQEKVRNLQEQVQTAPIRRQQLQANAVEAIAKAEFYRRAAGLKDDKDFANAMKLYEQLDKQTSGIAGILNHSENPDDFSKALEDKRKLAAKLAAKALGKYAKATGSQAKPADKSTAKNKSYIQTATDGAGNQVGFNAETKQWEPIPK